MAREMMMSSSIRYAEDDGRPLPIPNPTTQPYFDAAKEGRLSLPRCPRDGFFFYPRTHCPKCLGDDWDWADASGRGDRHTPDAATRSSGRAARAPRGGSQCRDDGIESPTAHRRPAHAAPHGRGGA